ncbi:hypothetical protein FHP29_17375 [Nocardioides albidus]|uniref:Uncharacterized protein n=1 Tax=Nocardioides albidus TaxID=1517589 RepID=A0A5C4VP26_9ACTN|nr:DUF6281 family protein [Nocardioides albidus]TNM37572.1 hypothetical protein FHP29_17375 [Nocardioides albidus]
MLNALVLLLGVMACSTDRERSAGDCDAVIRVENRTYTAVTMTNDKPAEKFATAQMGRCEDVGASPPGVVFDGDVDQVQSWVFEGYDSDVVLGVRVSDSWQVFVEDSVTEAEREGIVSAFS